MFTFIKDRLLSLWTPWTPWTLLTKFIRKLRIGVFALIHRPADSWPLTDRQIDRKTDEFLQSIDKDAIRALGSKHHDSNLSCDIIDQRRGSFNTCFFLQFSDGSLRIVRIPHEPAGPDVWEKLQSEVVTMEYIRRNTNIPVPRVYTHGRSPLCRDTSEPQCFMVMEHLRGQALTKTDLENTAEPLRRRFLEQLIDIFAELRKLPFTQGGSLFELKAGNAPHIIGALSMRNSELHTAGRALCRTVTINPQEFFREQRRLLHQMWTIPEKDLDSEEAEQDEFALQFVSQPEVEKRLAIPPSDGTFFLAHCDLSCRNLLVDDELNISGVIDWEYTTTVPRCASIPPTWITGNRGGPPNLPEEFFSVLSSVKHKSKYHSQLAVDWGFQDALRWSLLHVLIDPVDLRFIFRKQILPNITASCGIPSPDMLQLRRGVDRRLAESRRYTKYLQDNNLDEETYDEEIKRVLNNSKAALQALEAGQSPVEVRQRYFPDRAAPASLGDVKQ